MRIIENSKFSWCSKPWDTKVNMTSVLQEVKQWMNVESFYTSIWDPGIIIAI